MRTALRHWRDLRRFRRLPAVCRRVVFCSEGGAYWSHLAPLVHHLTTDHGIAVCYVSSDENDPGLHTGSERVLPLVVGTGTARTVFFRTLKAGVLVMTMPDLETFHIRRSVHAVHYVYVHHSIVSSHMVYRRGAFDHFDTIFCVGPHHMEETRETERLDNLPPKELFPHGYGRLDTIIGEAQKRGSATTAAPAEGLRVLVAPSWGPHGLLETMGEDVVGVLLAAGMRVIVRPHPQTVRLARSALDSLRARFQDNALFSYDEDVDSRDSLLSAQAMVSDWSGAALEFAFGVNRPVVFLDMPRKVLNPDYERLRVAPIEIALRERLGTVLPPSDIGALPAAVRRLHEESPARQGDLRQLCQAMVFNVGRSGAVGAARIAEIASEEKRGSGG